MKSSAPKNIFKDADGNPVLQFRDEAKGWDICNEAWEGELLGLLLALAVARDAMQDGLDELNTEIKNLQDKFKNPISKACPKCKAIMELKIAKMDDHYRYQWVCLACGHKIGNLGIRYSFKK